MGQAPTAVRRAAAMRHGDGDHATARRGDDERDEAQAWRPLTRHEAEALRASRPSVSPWRVVGVQVVVGLLLAPRLVQPLSWPALLAGLVVCMKVYWIALLWRGR